MGQEVKDILDHIAQQHSFLLSGGAGSGKTYTLVQVIRNVLEQHPDCRIACMTYTNAAAAEIEHRINDDRLVVSTIHDFLWSHIKNYQKELKHALVDLLNHPDSQLVKPANVEGVVPEDYFDNREAPVKVDYREYLRLKEGIISHEQVLLVAQYMFDKYPRLVDIVKSSYPFIFIDEYQDTHPEVVKILLESFKKTSKSCIIGFFGDSMQAIYDDGVGDISSYLHTIENPDGFVYEVKKEQNRRCPQAVINLANKVRTDGLVQRASEDVNAPNMVDGHVKTGSCRFFYSRQDDEAQYQALKSRLSTDGWKLDDAKQVKELRLSYKLIASEAGFDSLHEIFSKDQILAYKRLVKDYLDGKTLNWDYSVMTFGEVLNQLNERYPENQKEWQPSKAMQQYMDENPQWYELAKSINFKTLCRCYVDQKMLLDNRTEDEDAKTSTRSKLSPLITHLFNIESCIRFYHEKKYNDFIRTYSTNYITHASQKKELSDAIGDISRLGESEIGEVMDFCDQLNVCKEDDKLKSYIDDNPYLYQRVRKVKYEEVKNLFDFVMSMKPFSTQHKTKGLEYENVLIVLDNGKWNKYNFKSLFCDVKTTDSVKHRTRKLFYVCCTRAKENLVCYFPSASDDVIEGAKKMFGEENVIEL